MKFNPPFFVIEIPLNKDGNGPCADPDKVDRVVYEVWDETFQTVAVYTDKLFALDRAIRMEKYLAGEKGNAAVSDIVLNPSLRHRL